MSASDKMLTIGLCLGVFGALFAFAWWVSDLLTRPDENYREQLRLARQNMNIAIKVSCHEGDDFFMQALHRGLLPQLIREHRELMTR